MLVKDYIDRVFNEYNQGIPESKIDYGQHLVQDIPKNGGIIGLEYQVGDIEVFEESGDFRIKWVSQSSNLSIHYNLGKLSDEYKGKLMELLLQVYFNLDELEDETNITGVRLIN